MGTMELVIESPLGCWQCGQVRGTPHLGNCPHVKIMLAPVQYVDPWAGHPDTDKFWR